MNNIIPIIEDDKLFEESAFPEFLLKCTNLLHTKGHQIYQHEIHMELLCLKQNIEHALSQQFWKVTKSLGDLNLNADELNWLNKNVTTILLTWETHVIPWTNKHMINSEHYVFKKNNLDTPLKIKILCDVLLKKEYTFEGYNFNQSGPFNLFIEPYKGIIQQNIFQYCEHEANLKLLVSEQSDILDMQDLEKLINDYSYSAQKAWPTFTPTQKARLLLNVLWMFTTTYPETASSKILTTYLAELNQYEDFNRLITLTKIFDIKDKDIMISILADKYQAPTVELPELLNNQI